MESISWKIIDTYFRDNPQNLVAHHLVSYDDFFQSGIHRIFKENNPVRFVEPDSGDKKKPNECLLYLGGKDGNKIYYGKPIIYDENQTHYMYPNDARLRDMTYGITIQYDVDVELTFNDGEEPRIETMTLEKILLGRFPIMLKSKLCILNGLADDVCFNLGECKNDKGGYFIIDGLEKAIVPQETFADNMLYVKKYKEGEKYSYSAEIRSVSEDTSKQVRKTSVKMVSPSSKFSHQQIVVDVPNVRQPVPLFILMRALGIISDKSIIETCLLDLENNESYIDLFIPSVHDANKFFDQHSALRYISTFTKNRSVASVLDILMNYFLPHVGDNNFLDKAYFVGYMVKKLLLVSTGEEQPTDRDNYKFKRVEQSGKLIYDLFREYYLVQLHSIFLAIDREYYFHIGEYKNDFSKLIEANYRDFFKTRDVEKGLKKAFKGDWGSQSYTKKLGVVQDLNRLSFNSYISQLRKTNLPLDASAKVVGPRHLNGSQWGFIDPVDTPDGGNIGLHKHLSISTHITSGTSGYPLIKWLRANLPLKVIQECKPSYLSQNTKVFVNGNWIGALVEPLENMKLLKTMKRNGIIPVYTGITFEYSTNEIHIFTDGGRLMRPIYYIENQKPSYERKELLEKLNIDDLPWTEIVSGSKVTTGKNKDLPLNNNTIFSLDELYGTTNVDFEKYGSLVEYIDASEEDTAFIATYEDELKSNKLYTHIEIHPSLLLGVMGNMIIYPEHNPYARNAFSCGQSRQAVSTYHTNHQMRIDKMGVVLNNGQIPLIKSRYLKYVNDEKSPYGVNAIVAIMSMTGYNVEDAILINEGSVNRGIFNTTYYSMYHAHEESSKVSGSTVNSYFADVSKKEVVGTKKGYDYGYLNKHGLIEEGTPLNDKMIVIGKITNSEEINTDSSVKPKKGQLGYVDKSFLTDGEEGFRIAKVRIREERIPAIGDKMASRAGQKGTIGLIIPEQDMPFTDDGVRPDLIINPHAIPSRMTIGQLIESMFGKACCEYGGFGDCTAFATKGSNTETYGNMLRRVGFHSSGNQILYNGMTGEQLSSDIFIGPTYYMRLKHMVKDKINYRPRGPVNAMTRQSVHGRANDGGLRIGEMERDGVISHGAAHFLSESFLERADEYYMAVCNKTGMISIYNSNENIFLSPQADGPIKFYSSVDNNFRVDQITKYGRSFSLLRIPYSMKLLMQELQVMNVQLRIITEDNVDTLTSMSFSDNIIKLTDGDVKFEPAKDKDYLSEYVERYKRIVDQLVTKLSSAPDKDYLPTPFDISELAQEQESEPVKETDSESYHPAPTESDKSTEEIKESDSSIQYKFVGDSDETFENNTPPVDWNPEGQGPFIPKTPPMPLDSSEDGTIPSPPQEDYFGDEKLTKIYDNMSSASRLQLNKLSREEQIDVLKKVYNKRVGEENYDIEGSAEKIEILETDDKKETDDGEEGDDESEENKNDPGNQSSSGGTKKVNFSE
tara:strand:+ start:26174 stop:30553 length:4380 start_codon:yes stop_codon:yes gene_type:complete